jgi:uncharacterized protein (TIRG00374 family)
VFDKKYKIFIQCIENKVIFCSIIKNTMTIYKLRRIHMKKLSNVQNNFLKYGFLIFLITLTFYLVSTTLDIKTLSKIIRLADKKYIVLGILAMVFYIILEANILNIILNTIYKTRKKSLSIKVAMIGLYYNLVTPFATGGQPIQIYFLSKYNVPVCKSTALIINKTILYQVVVTIYCGLAALLSIRLLTSDLKKVLPFIIIGISMNVFILATTVFVLYSPEKLRSIVRIVENLIIKIKLFKGYKSRGVKLDKFIDDYNFAVKLMLKDTKSILYSIVLTIIQITVYFSIPYFIYKSFELSGYSYIYLLKLQSFLYMAVSAIPTPGNIGANELAFYTIFGSVFPKDMMGYSILLYSGLIYYFILIVNGIATIIFHWKIKKNKTNL